MAEKLTREIYLQYAKKIVSVLSGETFYNQYKNRVATGASNFRLVKKRLIQDISLDWIDTIEGCLPNLDNIVRNPRKFIVQEEDIVDVSLAKSISTESVKHLAQHTNMISKVDADGSVTPNRILNITKEESFEIYENRFIYTLLLKLKDFVTSRYDKIKKASATQDVLQLDLESRFNLPSKKIVYRTEYLAQLSFDEVMQLDPDTLTKIERIAKIDRIITDFLSSSFAKSMRSSAPVRPPISRTNVILKEPNFKKALTLWQFVETYNVSAGFSTSDDIEDYTLDDAANEELRDMITLNTILFESMYSQHETDFDLADAEFAEILRIGEMDFKADEIDRDQYSQKLDEKELNPEEKVEEPAAPPDKDEEKKDETPPPETEELEKEVEKEIEKDKDKDVEIEAPPHEEPEDTEPDDDEFDQHLFNVRKIYKRPQDDKLRQDEIAKVKDAIDRCLTMYRRIKQDEIEERDREDRRRRQKEEIEKRAEAFRKQRDAIEKEYRDSGVARIGLGVDPFVKMAAKIVLPAKDKDYKKEHSDVFKKPSIEQLDLEDKSTSQIVKNIAALEVELANKQLLRNEEDRLEAEREAMLETELNVSILKDADNTRYEQAAMEEPSVSQIVIAEMESENTESESEITERSEVEIDEQEKESAKQEPEVAEFETAEKAANAVEQSFKEPIETISDDISNDFIETSAVTDPDYLNDEYEKAEDYFSVDRPVKFGKTIEDKSNAVIPSEAVNADISKPKIRKSEQTQPYDPWALSATTVNQRYSKASGKEKNIKAVDEARVAVGGIRLKTERIDPFAELEKTKKTYGVNSVNTKDANADKVKITVVIGGDVQNSADSAKTKKIKKITDGAESTTKISGVIDSNKTEQAAGDNETSKTKKTAEVKKGADGKNKESP